MSEQKVTQDINIKLVDGGVSVVKTGFPSPVMLGLELNYDIVVINNTIAPAESIDVVIEDQLNSNFSFVKAQVIGGAAVTPSYVNGLLTCDIGTIGIGESKTLTVTVIPKVAGVITNQATAKVTAASGNMDYQSNIYNIAIVDVVTQVESIKTTVDSTATEVGSIKTTVDSTATEVGSIKTTVYSTATEVGSIKTTVDSTATEVGSIKTTVDSTATQVGSIKTTVDSTATEVGSIKTTVDSTATEVVGIKTTVDSTATEVVGIKTTVDSTATEVGSIKTTVDSTATQVGSIKTTVDSTATQVGSIKTTVDSTATEVGSIKTTVDSTATEVGSIKTTVDSTATEVGSIKTTVDSIENKVDSLTTIDTETNGIVKLIQQEIGGIVNPGVYNLTTGVVIKDYNAASIVAAVDRKIGSTSIVQVIVKLIDHTQNQPQVIYSKIVDVTKHNNIFVLGAPPAEYEVLFECVEEGVYVWTAARTNGVFDSVSVNNLISSNTFNQSDLIMIEPQA